MKLTILGCGSALPKKDLYQTSQVLELRDKQFMIDCGEGAQIRLKQYKVKTTRLNHIFISHIHGDHCFGLMGLISTLCMMGRTAELNIYAHPDLETLMRPMLNYFCAEASFQVVFHNFSPYRSQVIYEDRSLTVTTLPLKHRVPTTGFLFQEHAGERHIIKKMIDAYNIPLTAIKDIKQGADFITSQGEVISNHRLTTDATPGKSYAYCSDTAYTEKIIPLIQNVDCLYHESTFLNHDTTRIKLTLHSSALQAATIAQKANAKQLILGHYSARYDDPLEFAQEAQTVFPNTFAARDGQIFEF